MNLSSAPSTSLPNAVAHYNPTSVKPVGLESDALKLTTFKAVEQSSASAKLHSRPEHVGDSVSHNHLASDKSGVSSEDAAQAGKADAEQKEAVEKRQLEVDQRQIQKLAARDREVRAHEQAHASVGGQYAGAASYEFQRGPDGRQYAVGGEVSIDVGREANPQDTLRKAQVVRSAALAPADPSPQDRRVAAQATQMETQARADIRDMASAEQEQRQAEVAEESRTSANDSDSGASNGPAEAVASGSEASESGNATMNSIQKTNEAFGQISSTQANSTKGSILDQLA